VSNCKLAETGLGLLLDGRVSGERTTDSVQIKHRRENGVSRTQARTERKGTDQGLYGSGPREQKADRRRAG